MGKCFHMKDLGKLKYFLGIEVARSSEGFSLCQCKYAFEIITKTSLLGSKLAVTPVEQQHKLALDKGPLFGDPTQYRCLVGRLVYLVNTLPDLT